MATTGTPTARPVVNKREQVEIYSLDKRWCFIANNLELVDGRCLGMTRERSRCLFPLSNWPDDVMGLVKIGDSTTLHMEFMERAIDQVAPCLLCHNHQDQNTLREFLFRDLFLRYRIKYNIDLDMRDV